MARINLLPWREERRLEANKNFYAAIILFVTIGAGIVFLIDIQVSQQVSYQDTRNKFIKAEIRKLDERISAIATLKDDRARLEERMRVIQDLQGNRSVVVHYFSEIVRAVPDGVFITKIERRLTEFNIEGVAEANNRVSNFMRSLNNSAWFNKPSLTSVVANEDDGSNVFVLNVGSRATHSEDKETI